MTSLSCGPDIDGKVSNELANNMISIDLSLNLPSISLLTLSQYFFIPVKTPFLLSSSIRHASVFISFFALHIYCKQLSLPLNCFKIYLKYCFVVVTNVMTLVKHKSFFEALMRKEGALRLSFITWQVILKLSFLISSKFPPANDAKFSTSLWMSSHAIKMDFKLLKIAFTFVYKIHEK